MRVKIKRIDKSLPLPKYHTSGSVGFDLYARKNTKIPGKSLAKIPTNLIIETPLDYMLMIVSRGSTPFKKGLIPANGVGIGDQDFFGPDDEYQIPVYNITNEEVQVEKGERLAQGIFVPVEKAEWEEIENTKKPNRGMFGSTGQK